MGLRIRTTKAEAMLSFKVSLSGTRLHRVSIKHDSPALMKAWDVYIEDLCRQGKITQDQYDTWTNPYRKVDWD